ncbi:MAG TPA: hypothetical protein VEI26_17180 [Terriglobales bacterium]|nr:hypothetical protein [Terriglobales bacterium]
MRKPGLYLVLLLFVLPLVAKDASTLPKLVLHARYVLVTTYFGDEPANARIPPDDRQAVADVEDAIQKWGRYTLVYERKNADLIFLVRKGRIVGAQEGVGIHLGSGFPTPSVGPITGVDAGDPKDMLAVYNAAQGIDSAPIWRGRQNDGLQPPDMPLFAQFRAKVEATAKKP